MCYILSSLTSSSFGGFYSSRLRAVRLRDFCLHLNVTEVNVHCLRRFINRRIFPETASPLLWIILRARCQRFSLYFSTKYTFTFFSPRGEWNVFSRHIWLFCVNGNVCLCILCTNNVFSPTIGRSDMWGLYFWMMFLRNNIYIQRLPAHTHTHFCTCEDVIQASPLTFFMFFGEYILISAHI